MEKNTLKKKKNTALGRMGLVVLMLMATTVPVFADISNVGENLGGWGMEQIWWIALCVVAFVVLRFVIKKAWVPCGVFLLVGSAALFIIKYPDKLSAIGEVIYNIATR